MTPSAVSASGEGVLVNRWLGSQNSSEDRPSLLTSPGGSLRGNTLTFYFVGEFTCVDLLFPAQDGDLRRLWGKLCPLREVRGTQVYELVSSRLGVF